MKITEISLQRPVFATVTILALVVLGLFSYMSLNVSEYPNVEIPVVSVTATYPGGHHLNKLPLKSHLKGRGSSECCGWY